MYFSSLTELWQMAGHGLYVWTAYGISFVVLCLVIVLPVYQYRAAIKQIKRRNALAETAGRLADLNRQSG